MPSPSAAPAARLRRFARLGGMALPCLLALQACGGGEASPATAAPAMASPSAKARLGERIFNDRNLSGSGRMSCASCHDPAFSHGPPNRLAVQIGGEFETEFGLRAAPALRYLDRLPAFSTGDGEPGSLRGGLMADGRADSLAQQARLPFFNRREMDNGSPAVLAAKLRRAAYAAEFVQAFGEAASDEAKVDQAAEALQAFQREDSRFHPYDSKFDQARAGRLQLSAAEQRGLKVFSDPAGGNCASCHPASTADGSAPVFTTFGYFALGVPRNRTLASTQDASQFDLGVCGPQRQDLSAARYCGLFRMPSLRNVATRPVFFHNGQMSSLAQVLSFYNSRDLDPARWYALAEGQALPYDDLPPALRGNVTRQAPFNSLKAPMSEADLRDLQCFLQTLSDGHVAGAAPAPGCD
ncbi:cytochrome c peroxidase [Paucibacter sp. APW11]|uniref:Cytochrome c peroxidase n=1 Tax=Roseateles aquae TaxID=3077235 RepID=A0ABU3PGL8_9BURK|nr:cytochrome c peroxidase [Paucibacter sp. APW11]MDT9001688.1 cytochrome c peroxidase [Paucibacter sp. APW11]